MWEGSYGKEPFDLRLTVLRLCRNLGRIIAFTCLGTVLFVGGYYVKNVALGPEPEYRVSSLFRVEYDVAEEKDVGTVHINEMTWNTYVDTEMFLNAVRGYLPDSLRETGSGELAEEINALLASNLKVLTITVTTEDPDKSLAIAAAAEKAMVQDFPNEISEITSAAVIDPGTEAQTVYPDVRPLRAVILSAVLSLFFTVVFLLLKELGDDSIWLPSVLRCRYGLNVVGTPESPEAEENLRYLFREKKRVAVCPLNERTDPADVLKALRKICGGELPGQAETEWFPAPAPLEKPECIRALREADGILLVVPAGKHGGKQTEYVLDFLKQQDCSVTAALLWNADEFLLRCYYGFRRNRQN